MHKKDPETGYEYDIVGLVDAPCEIAHCDQPAENKCDCGQWVCDEHYTYCDDCCRRFCTDCLKEIETENGKMTACCECRDKRGLPV